MPDWHRSEAWERKVQKWFKSCDESLAGNFNISTGPTKDELEYFDVCQMFGPRRNGEVKNA